MEFRGYAGPLGLQYYLFLVIVVRKHAKRNWKWRNKAFWSIFGIGGISIEKARPPWATLLAMPLILRKDCTLKFFHKQKKNLKQH